MRESWGKRTELGPHPMKGDPTIERLRVRQTVLEGRRKEGSEGKMDARSALGKSKLRKETNTGRSI